MDNYHSAKLKACKEFLNYKPDEIVFYIANDIERLVISKMQQA